jgi:hypothetical protein
MQEDHTFYTGFLFSWTRVCMWRYMEWGKIKLKISTENNIKALIPGTFSPWFVWNSWLFGWKLISLKIFSLLPQSIKYHYEISVADPGCLSRIPDLDFYPSRIPHLWSRIRQQHQKGEGKNFFCPTKNHKIVYNFIFEHKKFIKSQNTKQCKIFFLSYQKYGFGIRDPENPIPDPESRAIKAPDPESRVKKAKDPWSRVRKTPDPGSGFATLDKIIG